MLAALYRLPVSLYLRTRAPRAEDERGQTMAEYGLILAVIAVIAVGAFIFLGGIIDSKVSSVGGAFDGSA